MTPHTHEFRYGSDVCSFCPLTRAAFYEGRKGMAIVLPSPEVTARYNEQTAKLHGGTYQASLTGDKESVMKLRTLRRLNASKQRRK